MDQRSMGGPKQGSGGRAHDSLAAWLGPQWKGSSYAQQYSLRRGKEPAGAPPAAASSPTSPPRQRPLSSWAEPLTPDNVRERRGKACGLSRSADSLDVPGSGSRYLAGGVCGCNTSDGGEGRVPAGLRQHNDRQPPSVFLLENDDRIVHHRQMSSEWLYSPGRSGAAQELEAAAGDLFTLGGSALEPTASGVCAAAAEGADDDQDEVTHWLTEACERGSAAGVTASLDSDEWLLHRELQAEDQRLTCIEIQALRCSADGTCHAGEGGSRPPPRHDTSSATAKALPSRPAASAHSTPHCRLHSDPDLLSAPSVASSSAEGAAWAPRSSQSAGYTSLREKVDGSGRRGGGILASSSAQHVAKPSSLATGPSSPARIRPQRLPGLPQEARKRRSGKRRDSSPPPSRSGNSGAAGASSRRKGLSKREVLLQRELAECRLELKLAREKLMSGDLEALMAMKTDKDRADVLQEQNIQLRRLISSVPVFSSELVQIVEAINGYNEGRNPVDVLMRPLPRDAHRLPDWVEDSEAPPGDTAANAYYSAVAEAMDTMKGSLLTLRCAVEQAAAEAYANQMTGDECQIQ